LESKARLLPPQIKQNEREIHYWRFEAVSKLLEGQSVCSPPFYFDGYWFSFRVRKQKTPKFDFTTLGLSLEWNLEMSGLSIERNCFVRTEAIFMVTFCFLLFYFYFYLLQFHK
jgi:hypothetical protein